MIEAKLQSDGSILAPVSLVGGETQGDGTATLKPGDKEYDAWKKYLDRPKAAKDQGEPSSVEIEQTKTERAADNPHESALEELARWERKAHNRRKQGRIVECPFETAVLSEEVCTFIREGLIGLTDGWEVSLVFRQARDRFHFGPAGHTSRKDFGYRWQARRLAAEEQPLVEEEPPKSDAGG